MANICFLIYDFTQTGGAERAAAKLMNELVKKHNVSAISIFNRHQEFSYDLDSRIIVRRIIDGRASISRTIFKTVSFIRDFIRKMKCDYLVSIDIATALIGTLSSRMMPVKFILCDRSSVYNQCMYSRLSLRIYGWLGIHACNVYQVMTEAGKIGCIERYKIKSDKVVVIPNWIDEATITDEPYNFNNKKIITVGRASPEKNYECLIEIAEQIKPYANGWEWHIWGNFESEYGQKLLESIKERNLSDFLIHKGVTKNIYDVYKNYSMFVLTSKFEGMPNVILEALGSKLPVIAFDCPTGPSELIINGKNGYLIPMDAPKKMMKSIICLIHNQTIAEQISNNWNLNLNQYSKVVVLKQWESLFL